MGPKKMIEVWVSSGIAGVGVLVGIWAVTVAKSQLTNLNQTLKMNGLTAILQLEGEMNSRKALCDQISREIGIEDLKGNDAAKKRICVLGSHLEGAKENWLNSVDRLAYCISRGYVEERDWKSEYRGMISELIRDHTDQFGPDTIYTNILDLNAKWKRE